MSDDVRDEDPGPNSTRPRLQPRVSSIPPEPMRVPSVKPPEAAPPPAPPVQIAGHEDERTRSISPPRVVRSAPPPSRRPPPPPARQRARQSVSHPGAPSTAALVAPNPKPESPATKRWVWVASSIAILSAVLLGLSLAGPSAGRLAVQVSTPDAAVPTTLRVFVDGVVHCQSLPCEVELTPGIHFVKAEADGYLTTAEQAVTVGESTPSNFEIDLTPVASTELAERPPDTPSSPAAPSDVADAPTESAAQSTGPATARLDDLPLAEAPAPSATESPPQKRGKWLAQLSVNSIPSSNVLLDGRPIGKTPRVGLKVNPGKHSVTFVHPKQGRKSVSVNLEVGSKRTVSVRF